MNKNRPDLFFSFWIFIWFIIYIITNARIPSPKFTLIISCIIAIIYMFASKKFERHFLFTFTITKIIPLIILIPETTEIEILPPLILFVSYTLYLHLNKLTFVDIYLL